MTSLERIRVYLESTNWHGYSFEEVAGELLSEECYRVATSPFFAVGLSKGDVVKCVKEAEKLVLKSIVAKSGNSTFRALFARSSDEGFQEKKDQLLEMLTALGTISDIQDDFQEKYIMYSITVSPNNVREVFNILSHYEGKKVIDFEEADFGGEAS